MRIEEVTGSGSLCALARQMIAEGADPAEPVEWRRRGVAIFTTAKPLGWWAEREAIEGDRTVRIRRRSVGKPASSARVGANGSGADPLMKPASSALVASEVV